ncbi:uncharacterized protein JCM6883_004228 [Sporobolomyces salmoneus]|uniref:uncharacterized protein n=1 Tax=Sporobolomyces salmoneus TaxID=183962 RepID=UPI0031707F24
MPDQQRQSLPARLVSPLTALSNSSHGNDRSPSVDSMSSAGFRRGHTNRYSVDNSALDDTAYGILNGTVGASYGPFPTSFGPRRNSALSQAHRSSSSMGLDPPTLPYSTTPNSESSSTLDEPVGGADPASTPLRDPRKHASTQSIPRLEGRVITPGESSSGAGSTELAWEKEADDFLHSYDPELEKMMDRQMSSKFSWLALINTVSLIVVIVVIIGLFAGWPIYRFVIKGGFPMSQTTLLSNSTGQVPMIPGLPGLIDKDTPQEAYTRVGFDGETYNLVFSDEFEQDGRTFWPGDDPFWEAQDLHYWQTTDLEWYDPDAITTKDGNLEITMTQEPWNNLNFRSGMLQSWNKFCFTGGYLEVNLSLPGTPTAQGYWPGVWTMGNLGRAGYGASNDGVWPYSYNECDVGTLPNQTWPNGTDPYAAKHSGGRDYGGELSYLSGQRFSACTCSADSKHHPGPNVRTGRGAPEIDALEGQIWSTGDRGSASQSIQVAPFTAGYLWRNETPYIETNDAQWTIKQNQWHGSVYQESMSLEVQTDDTSFEGAGYTSYGFEYEPSEGDTAGHIQWAINGTETWRLNDNAMGPSPEAQIGQRKVSVEPMYINLNLAISYKFQVPEWGKVQFPGTLRIASVRVYQKGDRNVGCDPKNYPTSDYIQDNLEIYTNPNLTMFSQSSSTKPRNSLAEGGCS